MFTKDMIAPCGANCGICMAFLRTANRCFGCLTHDVSIAKVGRNCRIKMCNKEKGFEYCYECNEYPCSLIKHLDKRYRLNYSYSMIDNLNAIKTDGIDKFLANCEKNYTCDCGGIICIHRGYCIKCGKIRYINNSNSRKKII